MSNIVSTIVPADIAGLLDGWIEAERNGAEFPVPFEAAWRIAEYSNKANAKRDGLKSLKKGKQFSSELMKTPGGGRSSELISLSVDGFKHFCLMADTKMGEAVRQYFIESEKKWKLVQELAPEFAGQIEVIAAQKELEMLRQQTFQAEQSLLSFRHYITTTLPKATGDRVLGVTEIRETEYRTKVVDQSGFILNSGETLTKTQLAERYGFVSRTGKADTKIVTQLIEQAIEVGAIKNPWRDVRVVASSGFDAEQVDKLDRFFKASPIDRQRWIGE